MRSGAVARDNGIGWIEAGDDRLGEGSFAAGIGETEEHPRPFAEASDQAGFGHQLQMPADAWLALAENLGELFDVELALRQQCQDSQPRRLARGAKRGKGLGAA